VVQSPVAIWTQSDGILDNIRPTIRKPPGMMNLKISFVDRFFKWSQGSTKFAATLRLLNAY